MFRLHYLLLAVGLLVLLVFAALRPGSSGVIGGVAPEAFPAGSGSREGIVNRKQDVVIDISKDCEKYGSCPP